VHEELERAIPDYPKYSSELLNLKRMEEHLAKQKKLRLFFKRILKTFFCSYFIFTQLFRCSLGASQDSDYGKA
jgi:hypothetical protein